jgi:hypothetical protein
MQELLGVGKRQELLGVGNRQELLGVGNRQELLGVRAAPLDLETGQLSRTVASQVPSLRDEGGDAESRKLVIGRG